MSTCSFIIKIRMFNLKKIKSILLALSMVSLQSQATFSIIAYDPSTGQLGSALASCVSLPDYMDPTFFLTEIVAGKGVVITQAEVPFPNSNLLAAAGLITEGKNPGEIIEHLILNDQDHTPHMRQNLVLTISSPGYSVGEAYSGSAISEQVGSSAGVNYVIAGNELEDGVVARMESAFTQADGDLKSKLLATLVSVKNSGLGDKRCTQHGVTSHSAFIKVGNESVYYNSQSDTVDAIDGLIGVASSW